MRKKTHQNCHDCGSNSNSLHCCCSSVWRQRCFSFPGLAVFSLRCLLGFWWLRLKSRLLLFRKSARQSNPTKLSPAKVRGIPCDVAVSYTVPGPSTLKNATQLKHRFLPKGVPLCQTDVVGEHRVVRLFSRSCFVETFLDLLAEVSHGSRNNAHTLPDEDVCSIGEVSGGV